MTAHEMGSLEGGESPTKRFSPFTYKLMNCFVLHKVSSFLLRLLLLYGSFHCGTGGFSTMKKEVQLQLSIEINKTFFGAFELENVKKV
jgi:hypothetical protein